MACLLDEDHRLGRTGFRSAGDGLLAPGLYAWWADDDARQALGAPFGVILPPLVYAGQAGATKWPSGVRSGATLRSRIGGQHFSGNTYSSTFRRTLASVLREPLNLQVSATRRGCLDGASNERLSAWLALHMQVTPCVVDDPDRLGELEAEVLGLLDPPLNLEGRPLTAIRAKLSDMRRWLAK